MSLFRTLRVTQTILGKCRQRVVVLRTIGALSSLRNIDFHDVRVTHVAAVDVHTQHQRWISSESGDDVSSVDYEGLVALLQSNDVQLIDVREPDELIEWGKIDKSYNIPLGDVESAFNLEPQQFREKYKFEMPKHSDTQIVFSCLAGVRSAKALAAVTGLGFHKARHYPGGWEEWSEKQGLPLRKTK